MLVFNLVLCERFDVEKLREGVLIFLKLIFWLCYLVYLWNIVIFSLSFRIYLGFIYKLDNNLFI